MTQRRTQTHAKLLRLGSPDCLCGVAVRHCWRAVSTSAEIFDQTDNAAKYGQPNEDKHRRFVVAGEELNNSFAVERAESRDHHVANAATEGQRSDEFFLWILQSAGRQ